MDDFFGLVKQVDDEQVRDWLTSDSRNLLLVELFIAEQQARKGGKRKTHDTHSFEVNLFENLVRLRDALWEYVYSSSRSTAHVIFKPVQREIFAAPYVDRIVQHWIVNNIEPWWDHRLNIDSYSCRKGKGTLYGIKRLQHHVLSVSNNMTESAVAGKFDITGYFMHINRQVMFNRIKWGLDRQFEGQMGKRYKMLLHAISEIVFDDPVRGVKIQGSYRDWDKLPEDKSLFAQPPGRGMVIGNLTSQFFSNIYLDALDRFITIDLGYKHYCRYVDDFVVVVKASQVKRLKEDMMAIEGFLNKIGLSLNSKKTRFIPYEQGVPFLGMVVKGNRILPGKRVMQNFNGAAFKVSGGAGDVESIASYLGLLCHSNSGMAVRKVFDRVGWEYKI